MSAEPGERGTGPADAVACRQERAKQMVAALFQDWYGPLTRYAARGTHSLDQAEDVVQEAFTDLFRALLEGQEIANPKGWTLCVVRRTIVDAKRKETRRGGPWISLTGVPEPFLPASRDAADESESELSRLFSVLSAREEEVVLLRAQGFKYRRIASALGISLNSVKTLLARAVRKMGSAAALEADRSRNWKRELQHDENLSDTLQ